VLPYFHTYKGTPLLQYKKLCYYEACRAAAAASHKIYSVELLLLHTKFIQNCTQATDRLVSRIVYKCMSQKS